MFEQATKAIMSNGAIARPSLFHSDLLRHLLLTSLLVVAIGCLAWWCYLSAISLTAAHQLRLSSATPMILPYNTPAAVTAPEVVPAAVQSKTDVADGSPRTHLRINNQPIAIPPSGAVYKKIQSADGNSSVDISVNTSSSGSQNTSSTTDIQINSQTQTQADIHNDSEAP